MIFKKYYVFALLCSYALHGADYELTQFDHNLLHNPSKALKDLCAADAVFIEGLEKNVDSEKNLYEIRKKYMQEAERVAIETGCPVFMLGECTMGPWDKPCFFSRLQNPTYRAAFEEKVVKKIIKKSNDIHVGSIQYTTVGAGSLFTDLVILNKALTQKPTLSIAVHIIDHKYTPLVECSNRLYGHKEMLLQQDLDPLPVAKDLHLHSEEHWDGEKLNFEEFQQCIVIEMLPLEVRCKQFLSYFSKKFPASTLSVTVHDTVEEYIKYLEQKNITYPDITVAADIEDETCMHHKAPRWFSLLSKVAQEHNDKASNVMLSSFENKPLFVSASIKRPNDNKLWIPSPSIEGLYLKLTSIDGSSIE